MNIFKRYFSEIWNYVLVPVPKIEDLPTKERLEVLYHKFQADRRHKRLEAHGVPAWYHNRMRLEVEPTDFTVGDAVKGTSVVIAALAGIIIAAFAFYVVALFVFGIWAKFGIIALG